MSDQQNKQGIEPLTKRWQLIGSWLAVCGIFFALPLISLSYGLGKHWQSLGEASRQKTFERMDGVLRKVGRISDTSQHLDKLLNLIFRRATQSRTPLCSYKAGLRDLEQRFPGVFSFAVEHRGALLPALTSPSFWKADLAPKAISVLRTDTDRVQRRALFQQRWPQYGEVFGPEAFPDLIFFQEQRVFMLNQHSVDNRFFYGLSPKGSFMARLRETPKWDSLALLDRSALFQKKMKATGIRVSMFELSRPIIPFVDVRQAWNRYLTTNKNQLVLDDQLFLFYRVDLNRILWASLPFGEKESIQKSRHFLVSLSTILFGILALIAFHIIVNQRPWYFSIALRLRLLFLFATGLPLLALSLSGWDFLQQTRQTMLQALFDEGEQIVRGGDLHIQQRMGYLDNQIGRTLARFPYDNPVNREKINTWVQTCDRLFRGSQTGIVDKHGQSVMDRTDKDVLRGSTLQANRKRLGKIIASFMRKLNGEKSETIDPTELIVETVAGIENPLWRFAKTMYHFCQISFEGNTTWLFLYPLGPENAFTNMFLGYWGEDELRLDILPRLLTHERKQNVGWHISSFSPGRGMYPANPALENVLRTTLKRISSSATSDHAHMPFGGGSIIINSFKSRELPNTWFLAITTDHRIRDTLGNIRFVFGCIILVCLLNAVFLGTLLSNSFLTPIRILTQGVESIEQRRFTHRLPGGDNDELGDLSQTLNRVLEGMEDLEVASIVQASLIPQGEVKAGEFRVSGKTSSATELGGDYMDYQVLPDGNIMVFIGDVTGHGVPAALVMAMVKALVERENLHGFNPPVVIAALHRLIVKTQKKKKLCMTALMALVMPAENRMLCWPAGHPYPLFLQSGKAPTFIETDSFPLGSPRKPGIKPLEVLFQPGDRMVLYSDGLTEAQTNKGEIIDYQLVVRKMGELVDTDPQASCSRIFDWHRQATGNQPQDDDISVLILARQPQQAS